MAEASARIIGIAESVRHEFKNIQFNTVPHIEMVRVIEEAIVRFRPESIFTHHPGDLNIDHRVCWEATMTAAMLPQRLSRDLPSTLIRRVYLFEIPSSTDWAPAPFPPFEPNAFFDVTGTFEAKMRALQQFEGALKPHPHARSEENMRALARVRGGAVGVEYAEASVWCASWTSDHANHRKNAMPELSYKEKQDKLNTRIRAHKEFAKFDIDAWIDDFLARKPRRAIFDLGCGNGNHLHIYLKHVGAAGRVAGMDREAALIAEARQRYRSSPQVDLRVGSMDEPLPFPDGAFDLCLSNFAIYNASDPAATLRELKRVMAPDAELVLVGPTINNAREFYDFNKRLTGQAIDEITLIRTDRLRQEVLPLVRQVFREVSEEVINSYLTFPDQDEFLRYFTATMLYEEGAEKLGKTMPEMRAAVGADRNIVLSKEMLALVARR